MPIATVREYVRSNLGETYDKLTSVALYDGTTKPDVVGMKIDAALARFGVVEADMNAYARSYVADYVTRTLIPIAIDYYMVQTRLVDNAMRPAGVTPLGGEVGQNYNRVSALRQLDAILADRLETEAATFGTSVGATSSFGIVTSTHSRSLRTQDPYDSYDKILGPGSYPIGYEVGGVYVVVADPVA